MVADQRRRIFEGLGTAMAQKGYAATTVADVLEHAKVSRDTFYQQFDSKQTCFMASFEQHRLRVIEAVLAAPATGTAQHRFAVLLQRYLTALAAEPDTARLYLVEVYAAGPVAIQRRNELQADFVNALAAIFDARSQEQRFACQALVAVIATMTTNAVVDGGAPALLALHAPIVRLAERLFAAD